MEEHDVINNATKFIDFDLCGFKKINECEWNFNFRCICNPKWTFIKALKVTMEWPNLLLWNGDLSSDIVEKREK